TTVFADDGEVLQPLDPSQSLQVVSAMSRIPSAQLRFVETLTEPDQWTIGVRRQLPLHKFVADDEVGTELYVSPTLAEVVMRTTRANRRLACAAAIPHWLYFRALRTRPSLWRQVVIWTSALGTIGATIGMVLAITQRRVRYAGWLRWHYWTGVVFGLFT